MRQPISCSRAAQSSLRAARSLPAGAASSNSAQAVRATRCACSASTPNRCISPLTVLLRRSVSGCSRSSRSYSAPWRSAPWATCSTSMSSSSNTARSTLMTPPMTARRSSLSPSMRSRSALCARNMRSCSQFRPARAIWPPPPTPPPPTNPPPRPRGPVAPLPGLRLEGSQCFIEHRLGRDLGRQKGRGAERAAGKVALRPCDAAHLVGGHGLRAELLAQNQLGGAPADIDDQPPLVRLRQQPGHALVDQPRFFGAGDHVDRVGQHRAATGQEFLPVARLAQGLRGHGPHLGPGETGQPLAKPRQAGPAALHGGARQLLVFVETVAQAHGLLEVLHPLYVAKLIAPDFQAKTVGAEVDCGQTGAIAHVVLRGTGKWETENRKKGGGSYRGPGQCRPCRPACAGKPATVCPLHDRSVTGSVTSQRHADDGAGALALQSPNCHHSRLESALSRSLQSKGI